MTITYSPMHYGNCERDCHASECPCQIDLGVTANGPVPVREALDTTDVAPQHTHTQDGLTFTHTRTGEGCWLCRCLGHTVGEPCLV